MCGNSSEEYKRRYERGEVGNIKEERSTRTRRCVEIVLRNIRGEIGNIKEGRST